MSKVAWLEAPAGISGDMFLGALVDAGLPLSVLEDVVTGMQLAGVEVRAGSVMRGAIAGTKVDVCRGGKPIEGRDDTHLHKPAEDPGQDHAHGHRDLAGVLEIIGRLGDLEAPPLRQAAEVFRHLADAEARVHGTTVEEVHFHEVGAADALVDIVGTCVGLHHLGVKTLHVSTLPWSSGTVDTAHGTMPIPAPATVHLLEGWPTSPSGETYEQVTPTGAALVRALATDHVLPHGFVPREVGHGAGSYEGGRLPNLLRLVIGEVPAAVSTDHVLLLETHLDDVTGQVVARTLERALEAGALDAWWTAINMKKGRPGVQLSVLVRPEAASACESLLFEETPTLGVRRSTVQRTTLVRHAEDVTTPWGTISMKVRTHQGEAHATPEYEDCRRAAKEHHVPLREVQEAALAAWQAARG